MTGEHSYTIHYNYSGEHSYNVLHHVALYSSKLTSWLNRLAEQGAHAILACN
jgi:hypothetical protein